MLQSGVWGSIIFLYQQIYVEASLQGIMEELDNNKMAFQTTKMTRQ